jgi:hypothetical protein
MIKAAEHGRNELRRQKPLRRVYVQCLMLLFVYIYTMTYGKDVLRDTMVPLHQSTELRFPTILPTFDVTAWSSAMAPDFCAPPMGSEPTVTGLLWVRVENAGVKVQIKGLMSTRRT